MCLNFSSLFLFSLADAELLSHDAIPRPRLLKRSSQSECGSGRVPNSPCLNTARMVGRDFKCTVPPSVVILTRVGSFFSTSPELHGEGKSERRKRKKEVWSDECRGCNVGVCECACDWLDMEPSRLVDSLLVTVGGFSCHITVLISWSCSIQILSQHILNPPFPELVWLSCFTHPPEGKTLHLLFCLFQHFFHREKCYFCGQPTVNTLIVWGHPWVLACCFTQTRWKDPRKHKTQAHTARWRGSMQQVCCTHISRENSIFWSDLSESAQTLL